MASPAFVVPSVALVSFAWSQCSAWHFNEEASSRSAKPEEVLAALAIEPGRSIADIGSGGGYYALRFARAVGERGKVYAVDIDAGLLRVVERSARRAELGNLVAVLAKADDPSLPERSVDLVFVRDTYHHFADPVRYFRTLRPSLRPGARVAIIDYRPGRFRAAHSVSEEKVIESLQAAGYVLLARHTFLESQIFVVFADGE